MTAYRFCGSGGARWTQQSYLALLFSQTGIDQFTADRSLWIARHRLSVNKCAATTGESRCISFGGGVSLHSVAAAERAGRNGLTSLFYFHRLVTIYPPFLSAFCRWHQRVPYCATVEQCVLRSVCVLAMSRCYSCRKVLCSDLWSMRLLFSLQWVLRSKRKHAEG